MVPVHAQGKVVGNAGIGRMHVQWSANAQELSTCAGGKGVKGLVQMKSLP